jgi:hypothetical protein
MEGRLRIILDVHGKQTEFAEYEFKQGEFLCEVPLLMGTPIFGSVRAQTSAGSRDWISSSFITWFTIQTRPSPHSANAGRADFADPATVHVLSRTNLTLVGLFTIASCQEV